jgi:hypothetical protein
MKGDEIAYLVTFASVLSIILITGLLVEHLWVDSPRMNASTSSPSPG